MTLDRATTELLRVIGETLDGMADWRAIAVRSALGRVLAGTDDPGAAADWLREFLAQRTVADGAEPDRAAEFERDRAARQATKAGQP